MVRIETCYRLFFICALCCALHIHSVIVFQFCFDQLPTCCVCVYPFTFDFLLLLFVAGDVVYNINGFLAKNKDKMHDSLVSLVRFVSFSCSLQFSCSYRSLSYSSVHAHAYTCSFSFTPICITRLYVLFLFTVYIYRSNTLKTNWWSKFSAK